MISTYGGGIQCSGSSPTIEECRFETCRGRSAGGGIYAGSGSSPAISACEFYYCAPGEGGEIAVLYSSSATVTGCHFAFCDGGTASGAIVIRFGSSCSIVACSFEYCTASFGGAISLSSGDSAQIIDCIFSRNFAAHGGVIAADEDAELTVTGSTFHGNSAQEGCCLWLLGGLAQRTIENSILAYSMQGEAVYCGSGVTIAVTCSDVYGNAGGDWTGCIADQYGINGNIGEDPLFCGMAAGDYTIDAASPCAPEHSGSCGLIGALPMGCGATAVVPSTWGSIKTAFH